MSNSAVLAALDAQFGSNTGAGESKAFGEPWGKSDWMQVDVGEASTSTQNDAIPNPPIKNQIEENAKNVDRVIELPPQTKPVARKPYKPKMPKVDPWKHLPQYHYKNYKPTPSMVFTTNEEETDEMVGGLQGPLGFDLEWCVSWEKGQPNNRPAAIVQLSDRRMIMVIQVSAMKGFPTKLKEIIESQDVMKMGVNILNDGNKLFRDYNIKAQNLVELSAIARLVDKTFKARGMMSLANITATYTGYRLHKGPERTSNWEGKLNGKQIDYAANDAHCALMVYDKLLSMAKSAELTLDTSNCARSVEPNVFKVPEVKAKSSVQRHASSASSSSATSTSSKSSALSRMSSTASSVDTVSEVETVATASEVETTATASEAETVATSTSVADATTAKSASKARAPRVRRAERIGTSQHMRAYDLWHNQQLTLEDLCTTLPVARAEPLMKKTVISYVIKALQADASLPFDYDRLVEFAKLEPDTWRRYRLWIQSHTKPAT